jgi:hypothetical protein
MGGTPEQHRAAQKRYSKRHPERAAAAVRQAKAKKPDHYAAKRRADAALYRARHPERVKRRKHAWDMRRLYGFSVERRLALLADQHYRCAICGYVQGSDCNRRLSVDHDHVTGRVRGLLCTRCNSAIGHMMDDPVRLRDAAAYIERHRKLGQ